MELIFLRMIVVLSMVTALSLFLESRLGSKARVTSHILS